MEFSRRVKIYAFGEKIGPRGTSVGGCVLNLYEFFFNLAVYACVFPDPLSLKEDMKQFLRLKGGFWKVTRGLDESGIFLYIKETESCPASEQGTWFYWDEEHTTDQPVGNQLLFTYIGK